MTKKTLLKAPNGKKKLDMFNNGNHDEEYRSPVPKRASHIGNESSDEEDRSVRQTSMTSVGKRNRNSPKPKYKFAAPSDEEELSESDAKKQRTGTTRRSSRKISAPPYRRAASEDDSEVAGAAPVARSTRSRVKAKPISETRLQYFVDENEDDDNESIKMQAKGHRTSGRATTNKSGRTTRGGRTSVLDESDSASMVEVVPTRKSGRSTKASKSMRERPEDDEEVYADDSVASISAPRTVTVREVFQPLPAKNEFRFYHNNFCDVCGEYGNNSNKGTSPLIQCQSCTTAIHKICLGQRNRRDHLVTKIGEDNFVLQCKRCVGLAKKKDPAAPDLGCCWECKEKGVSCKPFSVQKTTLQEEKIREENDGVDPIAEVGPVKINNPLVLLFRCTKCQRGCHLNHLPPLDEHSHTSEDEERNTEYRFGEYSKHWQCKDCLEAPVKPSGIVAWRPVDQEAYSPDDTVDTLEEDAKEYLVRWEEMSYFRCTWMPGAWCWGVMSTSMRKAFSRKCYELNGGTPIVTEKDAIPEEYLRIEIVLDVKYSSRVSTHTEEVDKARITEVDQVLVKMIGLGYEEVVWESPPPVEDTERYADFQAAYCEYLAGKYFKPLVKRTAEKRLASYRAADFNKDLVMREQPKALIGGKLMEYQMDGMNWLCYNFHEEKNVILADEMGLGKTIQVIAALTALITEKPACYPFLIVVPNSTCPNWRREIKQWCPQLRVVAYYGTKEAREIAMEYELFPDGRSDLAAHIIVTSYEAPVDEKSRQFFKKIKWSGLIVDEGQRLKNDKNLLYRALQDLKIPWRVLLTGTPVQNNKLELFTLLQFLDSSVDACELDAKYETLTNENVGELWALIKPLILRRTKVQVLKFLPPMAQVIIPVTMSVVQKKLYKSILAKSPELLKAIYGKDHTSLKPQERGGLNNILMQLRKCLCHPFVYSEAIEERNQTRTVLHRNLVDASSKLQLLEIMLPKLQERGHRVLIFSQFLKQLDIVEDFLIGLGMQFHRLDGSVGTLEKQKRIDAFNAPDSPLFAFLLSTRAGGVGINLATADTVIIMDPDFNPHQDLQALSRAHRIGQKNKVLVFQLMTKDSAEEKIVQIGRKKMALDQAIIESMGEDDDAGVDVQTILQHGAAALFEENDENDIKYDSASVDKLLDRSQVEQTETSEEKTAESQFSFARIWQNDTATLGDDVGDPDAREPTPSADVWEKILKEREEEAQREELAKQKQFGRGKRVRQVVIPFLSLLASTKLILHRSPLITTTLLRTPQTVENQASNSLKIAISRWEVRASLIARRNPITMATSSTRRSSKIRTKPAKVGRPRISSRPPLPSVPPRSSRNSRPRLVPLRPEPKPPLPKRPSRRRLPRESQRRPSKMAWLRLL